MKALSLTIHNIWPMLKFFKSRSNFKVKTRRSSILVWVERSCHKEHTYESPITYHSKDMANVKVFADRETNRRTGQQEVQWPHRSPESYWLIFHLWTLGVNQYIDISIFTYQAIYDTVASRYFDMRQGL
jgi:hypothetical protein